MDTGASQPRRKRLFSRLDSHFAKNVLTLMTGTTVAQLIAFLAQPLIGRIYTPDEITIFGLVMATVAAISTMAALRYDLAIVLPKKVSKARGLVRVSTIANTSICAAATVLLAVFSGPISAFTHRPDLARWIWMAGPIAWLSSQAAVHGYWCNREKRYGLMSRNRMAQSGMTAVSQVGMGWAGLGVFGLVVGTLTGYAVSAANLFFRTRKDISTPPIASGRPLMREYRKMPLLNGPNAVADAIRINALPFLITRYFGSMAGQFNKAWQVLQAPIALINGALSQVFYQQMSTTGRGKMFGVVRHGIIRSFLLGVVPFALLWWLSPWLVPWFLGPQWVVAGELARVLVPWLFINFITSPVSLLFVVARRQEVMLGYSIVFMLVPISILAWWRTGDVVSTMSRVSWAMAGMLCVFLVLSLIVAKQFDQGWGAEFDDVVDEPEPADDGETQQLVEAQASDLIDDDPEMFDR